MNPTARRLIDPGSVWFVDLEPVRGREQGKDRPALVVSSRFHLDLTLGHLVTVIPLTNVERPGWLHRVRLDSGGWVIAEQLRTVSADRFRRPAAEISVTEDELREVTRVLARLLLH